MPTFVPTLVHNSYQLVAKVCGREWMNPRINTGALWDDLLPLMTAAMAFPELIIRWSQVRILLGPPTPS